MGDGVTGNDMTLSQLQTACYEQAKASGWAGPGAREIPFPEAMALLHSEVSEALECWRNNEPITWTSNRGKPEGISSEFADVIIRLGHYACIYGVDLQKAVADKLAYNATRPYRHGNKLG